MNTEIRDNELSKKPQQQPELWPACSSYHHQILDRACIFPSEKGRKESGN